MMRSSPKQAVTSSDPTQNPRINNLGYLISEDGSRTTANWNATGGKIPAVYCELDVVDGSSTRTGTYPKDVPMTLHITRLCAQTR